VQQNLQRQPHTALSIVSKTPDRNAPDKAMLCTKRESFENVGTSPDATIDSNLDPASCDGCAFS